MTLFESINIEQHVMESTHRFGHTMDVVITRANENILESLQVCDMISDHNLIFCKVPYFKPSPVCVSVITRKLQNVNIEDFRQYVAMSLPPFDCHLDEATLTNHYNQVFTTTLDKHAPPKPNTVTI